MESIFGLPAHPFFVHVPLVLVPLVCLGAIAVAVRPSWRRRFGVWVVGACALVVVATLLAVSSGEAFDDLLNNTEPIEHHRQLAETSRLLVITLFLAVLALVFAGRYQDRSSAAQASRTWMPWLMGALSAITVVAGLSSTVWITRTGHEGTEVVWRNIKIGSESTPTVAAPVSATMLAADVRNTTRPVSVTITDYSLDASSRALKSGTVSFAVTNGENDTDHEFVVIRGNFAGLPKASNGAVDEAKLPTGALIGRTPLISPQQSTTATYILEPGSYVLLCNISVGPNSHARDGQRLDVSVE